MPELAYFLESFMDAILFMSVGGSYLKCQPLVWSQSPCLGYTIFATSQTSGISEFIFTVII